jgi:hypothetical protein
MQPQSPVEPWPPVPLPLRAGRGLRRLGVVLYVVAAIAVGFLPLVLFTESYTYSDVGCRATTASVLWGDGAERAPDGLADECRTAAADEAVGGVIIAAGGLLAAGAGVGCRRAGKARATPALVGQAATTLRLGNGIFSARATVSPQALSLTMPSYLGARPWVIPLSEITVLDPEPAVDVEEEVVFASPLTMPGFYRAPGFPGRNLELLFGSPQRIPPLRRTAFGQDVGISPRRTRSQAGTHVDGIVVAFTNRSQAVGAFAEAGATFTSSLSDWARAHRTVVDDPIERQRRLRSERRSDRLRALGFAMLVVFLVWVSVDETSYWPFVLLAVVGAVYLAAWVLRRRLDRPPRGNADESPG